MTLQEFAAIRQRHQRLLADFLGGDLDLGFTFLSYGNVEKATAAVQTVDRLIDQLEKGEPRTRLEERLFELRTAIFRLISDRSPEAE
jgi:hypothetical protein